MPKKQLSSTTKNKNEWYVLYKHVKENCISFFYFFSISKIFFIVSGLLECTIQISLLFSVLFNSPLFAISHLVLEKSLFLLNFCLFFARRHYFLILRHFFTKTDILILFIKTSINLSN